MKNANRGEWVLVQAYNKHPEYERLRNQHTAQQRRLNSRSPFIPPLDHVADNSRFIIFKDSKVVVFYSNDLLETPPEGVLHASDDRAVRCVHGLSTISRWTGNEVLHRTDFLVPAPIVAYNKFMNGVDRMDQLHSTHVTQRREKRVHMTIFTYLLDLSVTQAYAIYQKISEDKGDSFDRKTFFEFKCSICSQLITPLRSSKVPRTSERRQDGARSIEAALGVIDGSHMLIENLPRKKYPSKPQDIECFLCRQMGHELKTIYSCLQCQKGFHVNCFTAFHFRGALSTSHKTLIELVVKSEAEQQFSHRSNYCPRSIADLKLPQDKAVGDRELPKVRTKRNRTK